MHEGVNGHVTITPEDRQAIANALRDDGRDMVAAALESRHITELPPQPVRYIMDCLGRVAERGDRPDAQRLYDSFSEVVIGY